MNNPDEGNFCIECGAVLHHRCVQCAAANPPQAKFCTNCGAPLKPSAQSKSPNNSQPGSQPDPFDLADTSSATSQSGKPVPPPEAERRQLTVMLCDLVGSSALAEILDPEDLQLVFRAYQESCATVIDRFGGYIARYVGDGLLVYFGYPVANEDDAQRAIYASLGIIQHLPTLNNQLSHSIEGMQANELQIRIGIHTGLVVAGEMGGGRFRDPLAIVGETPNIAARLQALAEPNTVFISATTASLVGGLFELASLGRQRLKGIGTPMVVYQVLGEQRRTAETVEPTRLTPLIGRRKEIALLEDCWQQAKAGHGQAVLLGGEAGIGKSRLVQELQHQVRQDGARSMAFRCSAYYQHSALYSIIEYLQQGFQFERSDSPQIKLNKIEKTLGAYRFPKADTLPLLAALFSLPHPDGYPELHLSPQKQKEKTLDALLDWLLEESEKETVCCTWEDLHWADPSTIELLSLYLQRVSSARTLALLLHRPDFTPPWEPHPSLKQITLSRLGHDQIEEMTRKLTGGRGLPAEVVKQVVDRTDGVPLFVEELTKMVIESDVLQAVNDHYELKKPLPQLAIPNTLHALLTARLDRLGPAKEIAQLGATLGRDFSYELIQAVSPFEDKVLRRHLYTLVEAELVVQQGLPPHSRYVFRHALIQNTAYQSLLKRTRQRYHRQIGEVLENQFTDIVSAQPELVAHHYTEAMLSTQAIPFWQQAGHKATQASANIEAVQHLTNGLQLLESLPDTPERMQRELSLLLTLGAPLIATQGYASPTVGATYSRAQELCREISQESLFFPALWGLCAFSAVRAQLQTAWEIGQQLLQLAQTAQDSALLIMAHLGLGGTLLWQGEFSAAREHLEQGVALYDPLQHHELAFTYGYDPGMACLSYASLALWILGYPDQALRSAEAALRLAEQFSHPYSQVHTLSWAAVLRQYRREGVGAQENAEPAIALSSEHGFPLWLAMATALRGWALAQQGQLQDMQDSLDQVQQGMETWQATGAAWGRSYYPALLAEVAGHVGQTPHGLQLLEQTLVEIEHGEERIYAAELHRLKGELLLNVEGGRRNDERQEPTTPTSSVHHSSLIIQRSRAAEECFRQAITIAQRQNAKSFELRTAVSLGRLWRSQGKTSQAKQLLQPLVDWFTEGFETADLKAAQALLEQLG